MVLFDYSRHFKTSFYINEIILDFDPPKSPLMHKGIKGGLRFVNKQFGNIYFACFSDQSE